MSRLHFTLGGSRGAPRSPLRTTYFKLILMCMLLVVLLAMMLNPELLHVLGLPRWGAARTQPAAPVVREPRVEVLTESRPAWPPATRSASAPASERYRPPLTGLPLGIDRAILNDVEEGQPIEAAPYFEALKAVRALPGAAFAQLGIPSVNLANLFADPVLFRGRLVTVRGNLRGLVRQPLQENAAGLDHVYVARIRDDDWSEYNYTMVLVEDPQPEAVVGRDVAATGVFFKLAEGRDEKGTLRRFPLLMGQRLRVTEPRSTGQHQAAYTLGAVVGSVLLVVVILMVVMYRRSDRKFYRRFRLPRSEDVAGFEPLSPPGDAQPAGDDKLPPADGAAGEEDARHGRQQP